MVEPVGSMRSCASVSEGAFLASHCLLTESIVYALEHRSEALGYATRYARELEADPVRSDRFVGMYVNDWTLDFGPRGREAVSQLLQRGHAAGVIPHLAEPEFVES